MGKRISLHLEEQLLDDLLRLTGETSITRAIRRAIEELVQRERSARIDELRSLMGKIDLVDNWYELRHMEPR